MPPAAPEPLARHLERELGVWPPPAPFTVTTTPARQRPGWDGRTRPVMGVRTPDGTVIAVDESRYERVAGIDSADELAAALDGRLVSAIFRWTDAPARDIEALGEWRPVDDPVVPEWLHPFGGDVLVELEDGKYIAGVGLKRHDDDVWEISVGTEEAARGKGIARRLVVTAARSVVDAGRTPTYLHDPTNHASAKVADASGFPEIGWRMLFLAPRRTAS